MKKLTFLLMVLFFTTADAQQHKVVIQMTSADTSVFKALVNNIRHLREGFENNIQVEVVVHGPGIDFLTAAKTTQTESIAALQQSGVQFMVCENTMKQRNVTKEQLLPGTGFVKVGVAEVVLKEEQGWSYLKAGF